MEKEAQALGNMGDEGRTQNVWNGFTLRDWALAGLVVGAIWVVVILGMLGPFIGAS